MGSGDTINGLDLVLMLTPEQQAWREDRYSFFEFVRDLEFDPLKKEQPTNQFKIDRMVRLLATLPPVKKPRTSTDINRFLVKFYDQDNQIAFAVMPELAITALVGKSCMSDFKTTRANILRTVEGDDSWVTHQVLAAIAPTQGNRELAERWLHFFEDAVVNPDAFDEYITTNGAHITHPEKVIKRLFIFLHSSKSEELFNALVLGMGQIYHGHDRRFESYNGEDKKLFGKLKPEVRDQLSFITFDNLAPAGFWSILNLHSWEHEEAINPNWFRHALTTIGTSNKAMFFAKTPEISRKYFTDMTLIQFKDDFDTSELEDIMGAIEADIEGFSAGLAQCLAERAAQLPPHPSSLSTYYILGELNAKFQVVYDIIQSFERTGKQNIWHGSDYNRNKYLKKEDKHFQLTDTDIETIYDHLQPEIKEEIQELCSDWQSFKDVLRGFGWIDMKVENPRKMKISETIFTNFRNKVIKGWEAVAEEFAKFKEEDSDSDSEPPKKKTKEPESPTKKTKDAPPPSSDSEPEPPKKKSKKKPEPEPEPEANDDEEESTPTNAEDH